MRTSNCWENRWCQRKWLLHSLTAVIQWIIIIYIYIWIKVDQSVSQQRQQTLICICDSHCDLNLWPPLVCETVVTEAVITSQDTGSGGAIWWSWFPFCGFSLLLLLLVSDEFSDNSALCVRQEVLSTQVTQSIFCRINQVVYKDCHIINYCIYSYRYLKYLLLMLSIITFQSLLKHLDIWNLWQRTQTCLKVCK